MMEKLQHAQSIWPHADMERPGGNRSLRVMSGKQAARDGDYPCEAGTPNRYGDGGSGIAIGYIVRDVHRAFSRALQARIASHGVSMGQWFFLRALWDEDGLTQRELSQRVGMMEPTTVTALNGMERRNLVERVRNTHDRRKVNIFLTPKGRALREVLLPCSVGVNEQATQGISAADLARAIQVLSQMAVNLNATGASESGFDDADRDAASDG